MKANRTSITIVVLIAVFMSGCKKDTIPYYDNMYDAIRFPGPVNLGQSEPKGYDGSTEFFYANYSFIDNPFVEYTVYDIPLVLVGKRADHDRKINYIIDAVKSSAPSDSYEIIESVVPTDSIAGYIRIKLYNVEALDEEVFDLYITLAESEELSLAPAKYTNAIMSWHNNLPAPTLSSQIRTYNHLIASTANYTSTSIAYYSPNALKAIVDALGWDDWDDYQIHGPSYNSNGYPYLPRSTIFPDDSYKSYAIKLGIYIKAYNESHSGTTLIHNAGELKGEPIVARVYDK